MVEKHCSISRGDKVRCSRTGSGDRTHLDLIGSKYEDNDKKTARYGASQIVRRKTLR